MVFSFAGVGRALELGEEMSVEEAAEEKSCSLLDPSLLLSAGLI
jgi:hypothetical protein